MNTFFTPVDSPSHSDDEDISKKQGDLRSLSRSSELSMFLAKLTPDKVGEIIWQNDIDECLDKNIKSEKICGNIE